MIVDTRRFTAWQTACQNLPVSATAEDIIDYANIVLRDLESKNYPVPRGKKLPKNEKGNQLIC